MNNPARRRALVRGGSLAATLWVGALLAGRLVAGEREDRVIEIEAKRFEYTPNEIRVKRGGAVTLAFRSIDFVHGFSLPDLGVRADLVPGRVTEVRIKAKEAGKFLFLCDNFCGDRHEEMNGMLIVEA
ncbi:putative cytochrome C oxidase polypeptide II oxidoreductase protein [Candidatus Accumulibacter aalborgensis]|uniref:Nitrous-oxide reductase n=1 Tax=Candidatus Accumulibacter aalborgensis TaxID=1860102 RepID=A0A1A8XFZ7_9PROT|nr:cupredoxin domain-containing protein [Candidatus Accumulibacter aalborgensis]SBT04095.1 putative cytochrome C oxidase polypeptide II oxidoreductase protein [Candidatus Accumulibacter aalborgensis]